MFNLEKILEPDREKPKERYIPLEKRHKIIDDLR